ncbi:UPF0029-domain-containing protein [Neoconidiobolus thromboides FSU 785]|nr:UPF0029-domain-containing protein [Neoconidiobolus thromboides FSU 785]
MQQGEIDINLQDQEEEIEVIKSIYGPESLIKRSNNWVFLPSKGYHDLSILEGWELEITLPTSYPSKDLPTFEWVHRNEIRKVFFEQFIEGSVVLFTWLQSLEEILKVNLNAIKISPNPKSIMNKKVTKQEKEEKEESILPVNTFVSIPIEDRKSVFIAYAKRVTSQNEVNEFRDSLVNIKKIAKAAHNIIAYRIKLENGVMLQDSDDDGETAAGSRLLHLLQLLDVKDGVVIVSRYFGGIHLGPDRFKHINNVARQVLEANQFFKSKK